MEMEFIYSPMGWGIKIPYNPMGWGTKVPYDLTVHTKIDINTEQSSAARSTSFAGLGPLDQSEIDGLRPTFGCKMIE